MSDVRAPLTTDRVDEPDPWAKVDRYSDRRPPTRSRGARRLIAAGVGAVLAIAVAILLWQGFRDRPPQPAVPRAPEAVLRLYAAQARPVGSLESGGIVREGAPRSFCWHQGAGTQVCVDPFEARLRPADYVRIPRGTTLRIVMDARAVLVTRSTGMSAQGVTVEGDRLYLDWEPGTYRVIASGVWTQGTVPFRFGIEITPPAT